jgi:hypothetical protein
VSSGVWANDVLDKSGLHLTGKALAARTLQETLAARHLAD